MSEFGHIGIIGDGFCLDHWGAGPFTITAGGKTEYRFEDSDRFGPLLLTKKDMPAENQPGERSPFWKAHRLWKRQGRRTADDGQTCIYDPPRPNYYKKISRGFRLIVGYGDEDGDYIEVPSEGPASFLGGEG